MPTVLAQFSDIHLDGTPRATERATRVRDYLRALAAPVDAVLLTGDIADHGAVPEYEEAAALLAGLPFPVLTCPGNHDQRAPYRKVLLGEAEHDGPVNRLHHVAGTAFLMADSSIPGRPEGRLAPETLDWIETTLTGLAPGTPALLAFHHPPVDLHQPYIDAIQLQQPAGLATLLARHPEVAAVLTGHAHTTAASTFAGRPLLVAPGVTSTIRLPWEEAREGQTVPGQPPAVAFHVLDDDRRLTTHFRPVPA